MTMNLRFIRSEEQVAIQQLVESYTWSYMQDHTTPCANKIIIKKL